MKSETNYAYQKRIKELEEQVKRIKELEEQVKRLEVKNLRSHRVLCELYDWLAEFAKSGTGTPNAAYGLKLFRDYIRCPL